MFQVDPQGDRRVSAGESGVSGVDWDIGVFWNGGTTLEFLSRFKLRPTPVEVLQDRQDSFPTKKGSGPSSRDEEGKPGPFLSGDGTLGVPLK